jgi:hypothetical protein
MSLPVSMVGQTLTAISPMDVFLNVFNTNPYFIGITMLLLNLGGRFLTLEMSKKQEQFFQHPWVRRVLIFIVLFVGTRNIAVAFWATIVIILFIGYLFNENSALCIFGKGGYNSATCTNEEKGEKDDMTPEEKEIYQRLYAKSQRLNKPKVESDTKDELLHMDVYTANMALLRR